MSPDLDSAATGHADVLRNRLLGTMAERFQRRLTVVEGPPGYGKTTLLHQAITEARTLDQGIDLLVRVPRAGASLDELLAPALAELLGDAAPAHDTSAVVCEGIWTRTPREICLVVDDVHLLAPDQSARLLALIDALPANGHVVLCGRTVPAGMATGATGPDDAVVIGPTELAFDADERAAFFSLRGRGLEPSGETGWPVLLELGRDDPADIQRYLHDEVITHLDPERRRAAEILAVHRSVDDDLARRATGWSGTAAGLFRGLPLVDISPTGTVVVHDLLRDALLTGLDTRELAGHQRRVASVLSDRSEWAAAVALFRSADDTDGLRAVARRLASTLHLALPVGERLVAIDHLVDSLPGTLEGDVLSAMARLARDQQAGVPALMAAGQRARAAGDAELATLCIMRLAEAAYGVGRPDMLEQLSAQLDELATDGCEPARRLRFRPQLWLRTLRSDPAEVAEFVEQVDQEMNTLDDRELTLVLMADRVRSLAIGGHIRVALESAEHLPELEDPLQRAQVAGFLLMQRWHLGELDEAGLDQTERLVAEAEIREAPHFFVRAAASTAIMRASTGDRRGAATLAERARTRLHLVAEHSWARHVLAQADAVIALLDGDEPRATAVLRAAVPAAGFTALPRFIYGLTSATQYVLDPDVRAVLDADPPGPDHVLRVDAARALVAWREQADASGAAALPWGSLARLRPCLTEPHLAELAVAALDAGCTAAASVFGQLRHDPHRDVQRLESAGAPATAARLRMLERELPRRPAAAVRLEVLGPVALHRDGQPVTDEPWTRRQRVRDLVLLLAAHRTLSRSQLQSLMWPDKPIRTASANLRFTLNQLLSVLEPDRPANAPSWFVAVAGDRLELNGRDLLSVDVDDYLAAVADGDAADANGHPAAARSSFVRACSLYRGEFLSGATNPEWGYYEALRLRGTFVRCATRAADLCLAVGDTDHAAELAHRAVACESLNERAVRGLVGVLIAQRRLDSARAALTNLLRELTIAGITPERGTRQLATGLGLG